MSSTASPQNCALMLYVTFFDLFCSPFCGLSELFFCDPGWCSLPVLSRYIIRVDGLSGRVVLGFLHHNVLFVFRLGSQLCLTLASFDKVSLFFY